MTKLIRPGGGLSRRGVLQGAGAVGAAALAGPLGATRLAAEPQRGGTLRLGISHGSTTDTLDPGVLEQVFTQVFSQCRNCMLTEIAPDGSLVGEVAESWESTPDAAVWTFRLRPGIEFHSGKTLDAEDVIASINYHRREDSTSAAKSIVEAIEEMTADGPDTVVIRLAQGNADLPMLLSDYHIPILPAVEGAIDPFTTDGCGPYLYDGWEPGVRAAAKRNPNYWKENAAFFDAIEMLAIIDGAARLNALISGQVDAIDQIDRATSHLLGRAPGVRILSKAGTQHYGFPMDTRVAPFSDNNVRQALKYSIDREELVETILGGYGEIGNDSPIGRSNRFFNTELEQKTYDPDRARFHLREAGLDSLTVDIHLADAAFDGCVDAGLLWAEKARAAGISLNVVREPDDGYWSNVWMVKPFAATYWGGRPTEDWMFTTTYARGAAWNETFWDNDRFNDLLLLARVELDEDRRRAMYWEMQDIVANQGGIVIPMYANYVMALSDRVAHPEEVASNWTLDGFRAVERWWFA